MGRGTRFNRSQSTDQGILSGTTLATFPSGTTIAKGNISTSSGVSAAGTIYTTGDIVGTGLDTGVGTAYKFESGVAVWSGVTQLIVCSDITTITSFHANYFSSSVTQFPVIMTNDNGNTNGVSVTCWVIGGLVTGSLAAAGGTIQWTAIGT